MNDYDDNVLLEVSEDLTDIAAEMVVKDPRFIGANFMTLAQEIRLLGEQDARAKGDEARKLLYEIYVKGSTYEQAAETISISKNAAVMRYLKYVDRLNQRMNALNPPDTSQKPSKEVQALAAQLVEAFPEQFAQMPREIVDMGLASVPASRRDFFQLAIDRATQPTSRKEHLPWQERADELKVKRGRFAQQLDTLVISFAAHISDAGSGAHALSRITSKRSTPPRHRSDVARTATAALALSLEGRSLPKQGTELRKRLFVELSALIEQTREERGVGLDKNPCYLPGKAVLADHYNVSGKTVEYALELLKKRGSIRTGRGKPMRILSSDASGDSPKPITEEAIDNFKAQISNGTIADGSPLPRKVDLAKSLGVTAKTVTVIYQRLAASGFAKPPQVRGSGNPYLAVKPANLAETQMRAKPT